MKCYNKPDDATIELVRTLLSSRDDLSTAGVKIGITVISEQNENNDVLPALKRRGVYCAAMVRLVPVKRKLYVEHDVELDLDDYTWNQSSELTRKAIVTHELLHIAVRRDKHGNMALDDLGRPKLRLRPDDYEINGFYDVIRVYSNSSVELNELNKVVEAVNKAQHSPEQK